jgi:hypothetical protein
MFTNSHIDILYLKKKLNKYTSIQGYAKFRYVSVFKLVRYHFITCMTVRVFKLVLNLYPFTKNIENQLEMNVTLVDRWETPVYRWIFTLNKLITVENISQKHFTTQIFMIMFCRNACMQPLRQYTSNYEKIRQLIYIFMVRW